MNYYIAFVNKEEFDWCVMESTNKAYITAVFDNLVPPPEYYKELRETPEDIDTHISYKVIKKEI